MRVKIFVSLKEGVLDPQGKAIERSLHTLGYQEVGDVRIGKYLEIELEASSREAAEGRIRQMCEKLLANPVIENYRFEIQDASPVPQPPSGQQSAVSKKDGLKAV
jgi:phosphoribosylformylglycinamidine synthase PurS subunit